MSAGMPISLRLAPEHLEQFRAAAEAVGLTTAAWIRSRCLAAARDELETGVTRERQLEAALKEERRGR